MRINSLILLVTACHSAGGQPPRASQVSGGVIVRVFQGKDVSPGNHTLATDVLVAAHAPDGTALGVARTNEHGEARFAEFPSGGAVTIAEPHSAATSLHTVFGVHPGDVIDFSVEEPAVLPRGWLSSQWKLYPGAVGYQFFDGCNTTSLTLRETQRLEVDDRCLSPWRSVSAIVYALDGGGHHLAYATVTGVSLEKGTGTRLALGPWRTDFVDVSFEMKSPSWASEAAVWLRRYDGTGGNFLAIPLGSKGTSVPIPAGFFDELVVRQVRGNERVTRSLPLRANVTVAVELAAPPALEIDPPVVDGEDTSRPTLRTRTVGTTADMLTGAVRWPNVRWSFVASPDTTAIVFPALPGELAGFTPSGAPTATMLRLVDHSHFESWEEARRQLRWTVAFAAPEEIVDLGGFVALASAEGR